MFKDNWKKPTIFALIALFAVSVGVLVYPTPKEAMALNIWAFTVTFDWNGFNPGNNTVRVIEYDQFGAPVASTNLVPNAGFSVWSTTINVNSQTDHAELEWLVGIGGENMWTDMANAGNYPPAGPFAWWWSPLPQPLPVNLGFRAH